MHNMTESHVNKHSNNILETKPCRVLNEINIYITQKWCPQMDKLLVKLDAKCGFTWQAPITGRVTD